MNTHPSALPRRNPASHQWVVRVIGGGLAGPEAALTAARLGCQVDLYEMRAVVDGKPRLTPAHQTTDFGELVCSNSLKSESPNTAPWLLKQEMRRAGSAFSALRTRPPSPPATRSPSIASSSPASSPRPSPPNRASASFARNSRVPAIHSSRIRTARSAQSSLPAPLPPTLLAVRSSASPAPDTWPSTTPSRPSSKPNPST